jgi:hypothetical protein
MRFPKAATSAAIVLAVALALPRVAAAQSNTALAESLFKEGKTLLAAKDYAAACPKFAESAKLDPASGTYYALGLCYEGAKKYASAWSAYLDAATSARRDRNDDREKNANKKAADVEKLVPRVAFKVAPSTAALAGVELAVDGQVLPAASWNAAPIDGGSHRLVVKAQGKKDYEASFDVSPSPAKNEVSVPELADVPAPPPVAGPAAPLPPESSQSGMKIAGFAFIGVGAASVAAGAIFGAMALSASSDVKKVCSVQSCTDPSAVDENERAKTFADVSTITFIAGAALAATGVVLVLVAPSGKKNLAFAPAVAPGYAGLALGGSF